MPRVKIDYVVSFSSEDPDHPASNLLNREVSKKKWLCMKGESSCSVVLQLSQAVKITGVHIGSYHAALVEVLVGRSETSSEQFQVLVPSSVFLSREESRSDVPVQRVRSFHADMLSALARDQRWDRLRLVCSQPYNKHCKFGLSFVHVDEAEGNAPAAVPQRLLALDTFSSDEEDFKPGELFAKHMQKTSAGEVQTNTSTNTGAQIRQATSQALKNIPESSTKLMKTPINKPSGKRSLSPPRERSADRGRDALLYTRDDTTPHPDKHHKTHYTNVPKLKDEPKRTPKASNYNSPQRPQRNYDKPTSDQNKDKEMRKRRRSSSQEEPGIQVAGPVSSAPHTLLRGAVLVLSGYENPRRSAVRDIALALGARVQRDWGPACTHLICAFPNTPKLRAVRSAGGDNVPVVRADWLEHCSRRRRLLPWRWYATEHKHLIKPQPEHLLDEDDPQPDTRLTHQDTDSEGDTEDEIEKVLKNQKKRRLSESNASNDAHERGGNHVSTTGDVPQHDQTANEEGPVSPTGYTQDDVSTYEEGSAPPTGYPQDDEPTNKEGLVQPTGCPQDDGSTDEEDPGQPPACPMGGALPDLFDGYTFAMDAAPDQARDMSRYVRAYGGLVLQMSEVEEGSEVDYIVRGHSGAERDRRAGKAKCVSAAWLARCHAAGALLSHSD